MPKTIGYSLIGDAHPDEAGARAALARIAVSVGRIYLDTDLRGHPKDRPGLCAALAACRPRDVLAAPSLGRLALSEADLEEMTDMIINAEVLLNVGGLIFDPVNDQGRPVYDSYLRSGGLPVPRRAGRPGPVSSQRPKQADKDMRWTSTEPCPATRRPGITALGANWSTGPRCVPAWRATGSR